MSEKLTAGWFPLDENNPTHCGGKGTLRIEAWTPPQFAKKDPDVGLRPKLYALRAILIEREGNSHWVGPPVVKYSDGTHVGINTRRHLPKRIQRAINIAVKESRRVFGMS